MWLNRTCLMVALLSSMAMSDCHTGNWTAGLSAARRFERILHRQRRFLLFPPGSAIVTTLSFTKTLVPRSPSGINMIGECDVFYPLQTAISDWYPTTKAPPPPPMSQDDYEDDGMIAQSSPNQQTSPPAPPPPASLSSAPLNEMNVFPAPPTLPSSPESTNNPQNLDTIDGNFKFPTDQELGISANDPLTNDPNFNVGKHPGEIYVNNRRHGPNTSNYSYRPNSYYKDIRKQQESRKRVSSFSMHEDYLWRNMNRDVKSTWHPPQPRIATVARLSNRFKYNGVPDSWRVVDQRNASRRRQAARERRDLYEQLESIGLFKNIDPKACILRMICETKHYLLPPGKSLFQDIFRVLFTLPPEAGDNDDNDEYAQAMRSDESECRTEYAKRCRYSILGYLLSPERPIL